MNLEFKVWLKENATSTACVAGVPQRVGMVRPASERRIPEDKKKKKS